MEMEETKDEGCTREKSESEEPLGPGQLAEPQFLLSILSDVDICNVSVVILLIQLNLFLTR